MSEYVRAVSAELANGERYTFQLDVYDVLQAFDVRCPARQHAIKKLLAAGLRGAKDEETDLREACDSVLRALELKRDAEHVASKTLSARPVVERAKNRAKKTYTSASRGVHCATNC
jgi:hypothetical protein